MKAAVYEAFGGPIVVRDLPKPVAHEKDIVVRVHATGLCRSDWHGWQGHDPDIVSFPHVPGHELAGVVDSIGSHVDRVEPGQRVTVPFVAGCGRCTQCAHGDHHICDRQSQPGFTHWGSFAEFVRIDYADVNVVELPDDMDFVTAASLGCRFSTSFRAVAIQGQVKADEWLAVHGCGGVGLSAVMIGYAAGARVVAVDVAPEALDLALELGASVAVQAVDATDVAKEIIERTSGGAHVSIDAAGSAVTCANSIRCLRKRGRHVQVGLLAGDDHDPRVPMHEVVAKELRIVGSHGLQAHLYPKMFELINAGRLDPGRLVARSVSLEEGARRLMALADDTASGVTVIEP